MTEFKSRSFARIGIRMSLLCAALGAAIAVIMTLAFFGVSIMADLLSGRDSAIPIGAATGLAALFLAAGFLGKIAGKLIGDRWRGVTNAAMVGIVLVLACVVVATMAGALPVFLIEKSRYAASASQSLFFMYVIAPLFWILLFGLIPAAMLGMLYGISVTRALAKAK